MARRLGGVFAFLVVLALPVLAAAQRTAPDGVTLDEHGLPQYSTFSLCAVDPSTGQSGAAVTTRVPFVGRAVPHVRAGVGAVCTQASTMVEFGPRGLDLLAEGVAPEEVLKRLLADDERRESRQVGLIDMQGRSAAHSGQQNGAWAGSRQGLNYTVQANIMVGPEVVAAVAASFESTEGSGMPLAERMILALEAGQAKGGDRRWGNLQSAAIKIADPNTPGRGGDNIALAIEVGEHAEPVGEMKRIYNTTARRLGYREFSRVEGPDVVELKRMLHALGHWRPELAAFPEVPAGGRGNAGGEAAQLRRELNLYDDVTIAAVDKFRADRDMTYSGNPAGLVDDRLTSTLRAAYFSKLQGGVDRRPPNGQGQTPAFPGQTRAPEHQAGVAFDVVTVAQGLERPWGLAFLPDGRMLVTERPGRLRVVAADGTLSAPVTGLPAMDARGQGGLLDVAVAPDYATSRMIYWSYAEPRDDGSNNTAVSRGQLIDDAPPRLENVQVIYHQTPFEGSRLHYGSRLVFAPDGTLLVTQGDRSDIPGRMQAQNMDTTIGKIVRINPDGTIPADNPFVGQAGTLPEIWSIGHRNAQSAALHPETGELWAVEHGTRGGDELNIARKGRDYGWPTIAYGIEYRGGTITGGLQAQAGMEQPIYYWDPVIAPSGMAFYTADLFPAWQGSLFIGGLGSTALVRLQLDGERIVGEERLLTDLQPSRERIRDVRQGPDGALYLLTDNAAGRILKLVPAR